jgi:hypothetical protein
MHPNDLARFKMWRFTAALSPFALPSAWTALPTSVQSLIGNLPPGIAAPDDAAFSRFSADHAFVAVAVTPPFTLARSDAWTHSGRSRSIGSPSSHRAAVSDPSRKGRHHLRGPGHATRQR